MPEFTEWREHLRDRQATAAIARRIERIKKGNFGDVKSVGEGVFEMRIDLGPGYRIYYMKSGNTIVVLLCAGDKSTQPRDIEKAKQIAKETSP